ncbi:aminotransferase-like domain-containing protein [Vibrio atypicus]|uniref:aminotransferase-like domain-containing protein n=1 Tax=Vibrio atypicus TaxID=558271 RepID=UPI00135ACE0C|nr:PLP-dependent aminotransferase family protein [Vibrio atypicus]
MSIYKDVAAQFIDDIVTGKLSDGSRMPSLRQLAKQRTISMSTAVSCYQELESQGWICSRPQAGYFVTAPKPDRAKPEMTQFVSKISTVNRNYALHSSLNGPLGISSTDNDLITITELERSFKRATKRIGNRLNRYPNTQGEPLLRDALSRHFSKLALNFSADNLIITSGCMPAIKSAIEATTKPGDAIAISSPCFSGILELLGQMSRKIIEIPSIEDGVDLSQLEHHLKSREVKASIFCTSHMNPQGITMSAQQKQRLAELANHYQTPMIEDDVYLELSYSEHTPLPAKYYDQNGYVLWCGSVSKTLSPGYRLGWCLPGRYIDKYQQQHTATSYGVSVPIQIAVADFIDSGQYAKQLRRRRNKLATLKHDYLKYLAQHLPSYVKVSDPLGGMVLWLQVPGLDSNQLSMQLEKENVDIRLGHLFSTLDLYNDCLRINIGYEIDDEVKSELSRLINAIEMCRTQ